MRSDAIPLRTVTKLWNRYKAGESLADLGRSRGTSPEAIGYLFKSRGLSTEVTKTCALPECQRAFVAVNARQRACCRKHVKRLLSREAEDLHAGTFPCAVPECNTPVLMLYKGKKPAMAKPGTGMSRAPGRGSRRYCTNAHCRMIETRRKNHWYERLFHTGRKCMVRSCQERVVLDEHHVEFKSGVSNKKSKTVWICPTHHMAVHRGYAKIEDGKYVDLIPFIKAAISRKRKIFDGYNHVLFSDGVGLSWKAAKG